MPESGHPVRRRHLIRELKRLRLEADLSQEDVAKEMGWNRVKLHRIEHGRTQTVRPSDVRALLDLYRVPDREREALIELSKRARERGWWHKYSDVLPGSYVSLEAEASAIRTYECVVVPGLLQTADYASAIFRGGGIEDEKEIKRRVDARITRRNLFTRDKPPAFWAVIDEATLLREVGGPEVMREQVQHLVDMRRQGAAYIQILPLKAGAHAGTNGAFVILDFPDPSPTVFIENDNDGLYLEEEHELRRYSLVFDLIQAKALSVEESLEYLEQLMG
ncbi:helix-turn-helix domain-containing protein [Halostreptopolyspora alba]